MGNIVNLKSMKAQPILKMIGEGIEIYDINSKVNQERRTAIFEYIVEVIKSKPENKDVEILGKDVIKNVLPILTNILLDELSDEEIFEILLEPSEDLIEVIGECNKIITNVLHQIEESYNAELAKEKLQPKDKKQTLLDERKLFEENRKAEEKEKADKQAKIDEEIAQIQAESEARIKSLRGIITEDIDVVGE